jgi:hypothetical protein
MGVPTWLTCGAKLAAPGFKLAPYPPLVMPYIPRYTMMVGVVLVSVQNICMTPLAMAKVMRTLMGPVRAATMRGTVRPMIDTPLEMAGA